jgi:heme-degrading monooxygenase HmoA
MTAPQPQDAAPKPCPFCGAEMEPQGRLWLHPDVFCTMRHHALNRDAIAAWNRRAPSASVNEYGESRSEIRSRAFEEAAKLLERMAAEHERVMIGIWHTRDKHQAYREGAAAIRTLKTDAEERVPAPSASEAALREARALLADVGSRDAWHPGHPTYKFDDAIERLDAALAAEGGAS